MQYRDAEVYINNPTQSRDDQSNYTRSEVLQLGLLSSLPPTALLVMQRARRMDRRRHRLALEKDHLERVAKGYEFIKAPSAKAIRLDAEYDQRLDDIRTEVENIRALQTDPNVPEVVIEDKVSRLIEGTNKLLRDREQRPYDIYGNTDTGKQARTMDVLFNTEEYNWNRAMSGESIDESLQRVEAATVLVEHRHAIGNVHAPKQVEELTISGQKFYKGLQDVFGKASKNNYSIEILPSEVGTYRFKVKIDGGILKGKVLELGTHQYQQDHFLLNAMKQGNFDSALVDATSISNDFRINGQLRYAEREFKIEKGRNVLTMPTIEAYKEGGSAKNLFGFITNTLGKPPGLRTADEMVADIEAQTNRYLSGDPTKAYGKSEDSQTNKKNMAAQARYEPDKKAQVADRIANDGFYITNRKNLRDIEKAQQDKFFEKNSGTFFYEGEDAFGRTAFFKAPEVAAGKMTGPSSIPKGIIAMENIGDIFLGGSPMGKQSFGSNLVVGAGIDFVVADSRERMIEMKSQGKEARKKVMKHRVSNRSIDTMAYDLVNQKKVMRANRVGGTWYQSAFGTTETVIALGEAEDAIGVSRDQIVQLTKYGGNGIKDIIHNRNIDIVDVTRTIVEKDRHTLHWYGDTGRFTYARGGAELPKNPATDKTYSKRIMDKIDNAIKKEKVNYVLLTKDEAERIGAKVTESRRALDPEGKATKEYIVFFEEDKAAGATAPGSRKFRIFDGENSLIGEERNKHYIKATTVQASREQVRNKAVKSSLSKDTAMALDKVIKTADIIMGESIVTKEYNTQLTEAAFKKVLKEVVKYEFKGGSAIDPTIYGMYSKTEINRGAQEVIEISRKGGKDKNMVRMADRLFAKLVLDRDLINGPETGNKLEHIFDRLVVYRNKETGEVTNVDFKLNRNAGKRIELVQNTRKLLVAIQQRNAEALKNMEKDVHMAIAGFKAVGTPLLYTENASAYGKFVESVAVGSRVGNKSKVDFLRLQLGFGTPEGHQVYSSYALPYPGKYMLSAGPKMNMYDIASLAHMNPLMGAFYQNIQKESYFYNNKAAEIAATWNRKLNNTVLGEQGEAAKVIRKKLEERTGDSLIGNLKAKTFRDITGLGKDKPYELADTFSGKANAYRVLQAVQKAQQENVPFEKMSDYVARELNIDNIWFDNEDALKSLKEFSSKEPVTRDLLGTGKIKVSAAKLSFDVPLFTTSGGTAAGRSDFLLYRQVNPETDLIKQDVADLMSATDHLQDHQKDVVKRTTNDRLQKLHAAGKTNVLFMANDYAKAVIQMHYMDENLKQMQRLKKSGNLSKEDMHLLEDSMNIARAMVSKSAQLIQTDSEAKLHGKAADLGKIVPQFSANLKIQRSDYLHDVIPGLDWRTLVIGKEQANEMVRSHFIVGTRAAGMLNDPILAKFTQHAGDTFMADFEKDIKAKGTFMEGMVTDMMDEIRDAANDVKKGPSNLNKYKRNQMKLLQRRISHAENMAIDQAGTEFQITRRAENQRIERLSQVEDYRSIQQLRTFFSPEGLYGHVQSNLKKNPESENIVKLWEDLRGILDQHRIANNRKYVDQGRLWEGWKGIGERLKDKTNLSLIEESVQKAVDKTDAVGRGKADELLGALRSIAERTTKAEMLEPDQYREYQKQFGQVADLMMVHDNVAAGDVKKMMRRNGHMVPSQLDKKKDIIRKHSKKVTEGLLGHGMLANEMQRLMSFNTDEEIVRVAGLTDLQIDTEAEQKTQMLIDRAEKVNARLIQTAETDVKAKQMAERMSLFINTLKGETKETGFAKELGYVMKGIRGLRIGMTALGKADPDIYGTKHMQYFTLKMMLESDVISKGGMDKETQGSILGSLRSGKMFVSHVAAQLLDRDFDGDAMNVYASIIDQRFGVKKGNLSVHNVVSYMNDFSFTLENGRFLPTNATAAVKSELIFNEKMNARNVSMESAHSYIRKRMAMESASVGFLDKDPGGTFNMEKMIREAEDMWLEKNHGKKLRTDIGRQHLLTNTYVISEATGLIKAAEKTTISFGTDVKVEVHGSTRQAMGLDAYAEKIAHRYGLNISANKDSINAVLAEAKTMADRAKGFLGSEQHAADEFTNRLIRLKDLDLQNQRNLMVQKTATGELYKYPTLLRTIADTVIKEGGSSEVREVGKVMAELAQMGAYSMQEKIAIGMKKGGVDAVQGVNELFKDMFSLVNITDKKLRDEKLNSLYERISKEGLKARLTGTEEEVMRKSGYLAFRTGATKAPEMKHMSSMEVLSFGYTKQAALESMIAGDRSILDKHLEKHYPKRNGLNDFANNLVKSLEEEASRQKSVVGGDGSMKQVYDFMLREQASTNTSMAENHKAVVRFSEMGFHSVANLLQRAHETHELPQVRQMLNIVGSTLTSEGQVLLPEQFRKAVAQNKSQGLKTNILESMLHFIQHHESTQADAVTDLLYSGKTGNKIKYGVLDRVAPGLLGKAFSSRAAGLGLGLLGLGAFAPSPAVGRNPNSVVDKQDEYSTVLPEKMLAQYSNQANITQVNPWVQNRLKQEKAESAKFNHMFYRTVTG